MDVPRNRMAPWIRRNGWVLAGSAVVLLIYLASIAAAGPWDPWETHYGEVARQILVRHDPLDLWWKPGNGGPDAASERAFMSKPALPFWLMAMSMTVFGVGRGADPAEMVTSPWPEIAIRMPSLLAGLLTAVFLGYVIGRLVSRRAGVLTALVLVTVPHWAIVTRQALTDMFFVGPVMLAVGAWALAWLQPDRELVTRGEGWKRIPWDLTFLLFLAFFVVAAIVPLAALHQQSFDPHSFWMAGRFPRRIAGLRAIQIHLFAYWALVLVVLAVSLRWRRRSQVWMGVLYIAAGLSLLGKGMIGPGLIGAFVLAHVVVSGRFELLLRCALPIGIVIFVVVSLPWHHAMYLYRGAKWSNELIIVNNLQRFATGEQKQAVGSFAFYLHTLGIAALPWCALIPLSVWHAVRAQRGAREAGSTAASRAQVVRLVLVYLVISLWAISYAATKYYHYVLPCLPPVAMLIAIWLDDALTATAGERRRPGIVVGVGILLGLLILPLVIRDARNEPAWIAHLTTYLYTGMWRKGAPEVDRLLWTCAPFALGLLVWLAGRIRIAVGCMVFSALLTTAYVIDDYLPAASESWSQRSAMRIYFDERGPEDRLVSWWFYYRGETFFTKADIWVMKEGNREELAVMVEELEGKGASLWFITTVGHARRLRSHIPHAYRGGLETVYESFHYVLLRVPIQ